MEEIVEHLREPFRIYALHFENGMHKRLMLVHVARPGPFKVFASNYLFNNMELTIEKTGEKIPTAWLTGIQKVPNANTPEYRITLEGLLCEIPK